jgi:hypothetical protein
VIGLTAHGLPLNVTDYLALSAGFLTVGLVAGFVGLRKKAAQKRDPDDQAQS